jgi:hypothetical protein
MEQGFRSGILALDQNVVSEPWSTAWGTSGEKDKGAHPITGPLALTSDDTGTKRGGYTQATLIANGTNIPTFDGSPHPDWTNTANYANLVTLVNIGGYIYWAIGATQGRLAAFPVAPVITANPVITQAIINQPLTWSAATVTGFPSPAITYDVILGGSTVATNVASGGYTPTASGGSIVVRATATNASGSVNANSAAVTVSAAATVPGAPTALTLGTATSTTQQLSWTAPTSNGGANITDYLPQFSIAGSGNWVTFADGTGTNTSATITGLTASTSYDYRVAAVNSVGAGANSSVVTGSTTIALTKVPLTWSTSNGGSQTGDVLTLAATGNGSLATQTINPANYFEVILSSTNVTNSTTMVVYLDDDNAQSYSWGGVNDFLVGAYNANTTLAAALDGGVNNSINLGSPQPAAGVTFWFKLRKNNNDVIISYSSDGITYADRYTAVGVLSGVSTVYLKALLAAATNKSYNIQLYV